MSLQCGLKALGDRPPHLPPVVEASPITQIIRSDSSHGGTPGLQLPVHIAEIKLMSFTGWSFSFFFTANSNISIGELIKMKMKEKPPPPYIPSHPHPENPAQTREIKCYAAHTTPIAMATAHRSFPAPGTRFLRFPVLGTSKDAGRFGPQPLVRALAQYGRLHLHLQCDSTQQHHYTSNLKSYRKKALRRKHRIMTVNTAKQTQSQT